VKRTYTPTAQEQAYYTSTANTNMGGSLLITVGCTAISSATNICVRHTGATDEDDGFYQLHTGTSWTSQPSLLLFAGTTYTFTGATNSVGSFVDSPFRLSSTDGSYTATDADVNNAVTNNGMINTVGGSFVLTVPAALQIQIYYASSTQEGIGGSILITSKLKIEYIYIYIYIVFNELDFSILLVHTFVIFVFFYF
jgi:hypothetical protein